MKNKKKTLVSVVILNWNGKEVLKKCLDSFKKVTYIPLEIIVVDNGSQDGSVSMVKKYFPKIIVIANKKNFGFCKGNNLGIKKSKGEYILVLNNDTEVTPSFLKPLIKRMETDKKIGCIQPKLLYATMPKRLNACASYITDTGYLWSYGYRKIDKKMYDLPMYIYSARGAAMFLRKETLKKTGQLDEDFFIYFEETDLCHRIWLAGYTVLYEPSSVIYHYEGFDTLPQMSSYNRYYLSFRNRIVSYSKNLSSFNLVKIMSIMIPIHVFLFGIYGLQKNFTPMKAIYYSFIDTIKELKRIYKKRKMVQKIRQVSDKEIFKKIKRNPPLTYYSYLLKDVKDYVFEPNLTKDKELLYKPS